MSHDVDRRVTDQKRFVDAGLVHLPQEIRLIAAPLVPGPQREVVCGARYPPVEHMDVTVDNQCLSPGSQPTKVVSHTLRKLPPSMRCMSASEYPRSSRARVMAGI